VTRGRYSTETGAVVSRALATAGLRQFELAQTTGSSETYISQVLNGHRNPTPAWLDVIAGALSMTPEQRVELHRAAAIDRGYKLDLGKL
jgi:transcriptional regulator with XRE-family HTH domain